MPVPDQRDPETTRALLTGWLGRRLPGARIPMLETPKTSGFSSETLLFDAAWTDPGGGERVEPLVARVAPAHYQIFPEPRFEEQYRLMRILDERTPIPVPPIRWYEPSPDVLGAPFFVMGRIEGRVPTDMPPYHMDGWVTEVPPEERAAMWWSTLEIVARLHRLDADALGLGFLDQPEWGATGLEQRLAYYEHYLHWAYDGPQDTALRALEWLRAHRPEEPGPPAVLWGTPGSATSSSRTARPPPSSTGRRPCSARRRRTWRGSCSWTGTTRTGSGCRACPGSRPPRRPSRGTRRCSAARCATWTTTRCCRASSSR
ncbi:phosphotransferase family protein [Actinomadura yumaensis]|uniref:phosphotransferase family protein n=1 Tax=Actinomadura yumaensis TaxID=111807 RepID=UPI00360754E5